MYDDDKIRLEAHMFKVGDNVAVIHIHRVGKEKRREVVRIDTVEKVTSNEVLTKRGKFNAVSGFQLGRSPREYQIAPVTQEHERELRSREQFVEQRFDEREAIRASSRIAKSR